MVVCAKATIIAASILAIIYTALSYMGASSVAKLGHLENGGEVLAKVSNYYFGSYGGVLLGLMITVACLTTSVGLVSACSSFFHKLFPNVPYKAIAITLCVFSAIVAKRRINTINRSFCSSINSNLSTSNRIDFLNILPFII